MVDLRRLRRSAAVTRNPLKSFNAAVKSGGHAAAAAVRLKSLILQDAAVMRRMGELNPLLPLCASRPLMGSPRAQDLGGKKARPRRTNTLRRGASAGWSYAAPRKHLITYQMLSLPTIQQNACIMRRYRVTCSELCNDRVTLALQEAPNRMVDKVRDIGPYSRPHRLANLDGRTKEAALLRTMRAELTAHVGGKPSATQRCLIDRAAMLTLHVALFDARALAAGVLSERDGRQYLAYSNALGRTMRELGIKGAAAAQPRLADVLATGRPAA